MTDKGNINCSCPLALPAASFAAGIVSCRYLFVLPEYSVVAALVLALTLLFSRFGASTLVRALLITAIFFMVGNVHLHHSQSPLPAKSMAGYPLAGAAEAIVAGRLLDAPSYNGRNGKFVLAAERIKPPGQPERTFTERILCRTTFQLPATIEPGTRLLIRTSLAKPSLPGTPGTFDYRQYLADRNIHLTGFIRAKAELSAYYNTAAPDKPLASLAFLPQLLRHRANKAINKTKISSRLKGLYKAIITGERYEMAPDILDNFKKSGGVHLLAISGMHMALLALLCGVIFNLILLRSETITLRWPVRKISALLALLVMALYATISGMQPPVVRSFIMAAALIVAFIIDRPGSLLNILALAALLILAWDPVSLFSASFQMSFAAVAGIIFFAETLRSKEDDKKSDSLVTKITRPLITTVNISLIALLATAPISIYYFHQISILSPLTTPFAAPLICFWSLPLGLAGLLCSILSPELGAALFRLGSFGLAAADNLTAFLASFPYGAHVLTPPTLVRIAAYYLLAGFLLFRPATNMTKGVIAVFLILLLAVPSAGFYLKKQQDLPRVTFIDIGQGSATLLEMPGEVNILIDGGGSASERFDPGEQIIAPFLWQRKIKTLAAIVITHAHQDHYNGLEFIIRNFKPAVIWANGSAPKSIAYQNILRSAEIAGATIKVPVEDSIISSCGPAKLTCLSDLHLRKSPDLSENNRSLVLKLQAPGLNIIFPGDIEAEDGQHLIKKQGDNLNSDILLAPHHGSRFSAGYQLVQETKPQWVVVSASAIKKDFFPDPDFAIWLKEKKIKMITTGDYGSVTFTVTADNKTSWQPISPKGLAKLADDL
ncbi:MAG: DNA internalization-related competence protein ComEC/Rec2 [Thermodesulfobacteriota bacterium]